MKLFPPARKEGRVRILEVGASHVAAAELRRGADGRWGWDKFAGESFVPPAAANGGVSVETGAAVAKVAEVFGSDHPPVDLVIPGHLVLTKSVRIPAVAATQRERIIRFEAQQNIPFDLSEVVWDHQIIAESDGELEVMFAAVKNENLQPLLALLERHGLEVGSVRAAGVASAHGLGETGEFSDVPGLSVLIGARSTHLVFTEAGRFALRTVSYGGNAVSRDIADKLGVSFSEAEQLKLRVWRDGLELPPDSAAAQALAEAATQFCQKLTQEISRSMVTHSRQHNGTAPRTIRLGGGGVLRPHLATMLEDVLDLPVSEIGEPVGFTWAAEVKKNGERFGWERWCDLAGAAAVAVGSGRASMNLVPAAVAASRRSKAERPRWLVAAVLLMLASVLPGWRYHRLAEARTKAAETLSQRLMPVREWRDQNARHIERLNTLAAEAAGLRRLGVAQGAWMGLLQDLQTQLATGRDVWFERLLVLPPTSAGQWPERERKSGAVVETEVSPQPLRLRISGRLVDRGNPLSRVSQSAHQRVTALLDGVVGSDYVMAVEGERFDASEPGLLRFDFTLVTNPAKML